MFIALLLLPVVRAQGVADDDRLIETGVEVKRQIRGFAAEIDGKPEVSRRKVSTSRTGSWKS